MTQRELEFDSPNRSQAESDECAFCGQPVSDAEQTTVQLDDQGEQSICVYCAASLFEDIDAEALIEAEGNTSERSTQAPADDHRASAVSWSPPTVKSSGGVMNTILRYHYLSLSLLWAIHQTNVRIIERILDEIDVQLITILFVVLSAMTTLAAILSL